MAVTGTSRTAEFVASACVKVGGKESWCCVCFPEGTKKCRFGNVGLAWITHWKNSD